MTEVWLFIIAGAIAVAAAVMMLLSENAVHAALWLIVTMVSIAFLFLMLNSPFLAMIQITVYAGAIMVLFVFVIMLLGAERLKSADPGEEKRRFRWFTPVAIALAVVLLFSIGLATIEGNIDDQPVPLPPPLVRAVNTANSGSLDVYVGSALIASSISFGSASDFVELPQGEYVVSVRPSSGGEVTQPLTLDNGTVLSVIAYGTEAMPEVVLLPQDMSSLSDAEETRVTFFNGIETGAVSVALLDSYDAANDTYFNVLVSGLESGQATTFTEDAGTADWAFVVGEAKPENVVARAENVTLLPEYSNLVVLTEEVISSVNAVRTAPLMFTSIAVPQYGSPRSIGFPLFTTFLLPLQLLGLLLLAAMVCVIVLAHREMKPVKRIQQRRKVSRPLTDVIAAQVGAEVTEDAPQLPEPETSPSGD